MRISGFTFTILFIVAAWPVTSSASTARRLSEDELINEADRVVSGCSQSAREKRMGSGKPADLHDLLI